MKKNNSNIMENEHQRLDDPEYYMELDFEYGAHNYHPIPVVLSKGEGVWVWDVKGKKYLDCLSAYSAINHGHRNKNIINAMKKQLEQLTLTSRAFYNDKMGEFLKKLCEYTGLEQALPMNTGAEAVETGLKIARRWGYKKKGVHKDNAEIIVCENNFHGRTITIVGFSSDENTRDGFGPATPGFIRIPFNDTDALEKAINKNTVAFMVEPIQGEAGVIVPNEGYLKKVREICTKNNILLILDEIQTGMGRTGKPFAFMHEDIIPDILLVGKALGGGVYPVSAAVTKKEIMDVITPGSHGSTFGGNPLASAVAIASINELENMKLAERAMEMGNYFMNKLKKLTSPKIKEIRGKGLLIAIEFKKEFGPVRNIVKKLMEKGLLAKDTHDYTIRFAPPLIITKEIIDWAVEQIKFSIELD